MGQAVGLLTLHDGRLWGGHVPCLLTGKVLQPPMTARQNVTIELNSGTSGRFIFADFRAFGILGLSLSMPIVQEGPYRNLVHIDLIYTRRFHMRIRPAAIISPPPQG